LQSARHSLQVLGVKRLQDLDVTDMHANEKVGGGSGEHNATGAFLNALGWWQLLQLLRRWNRGKSRQRRRAELRIHRGRRKIVRRGHGRLEDRAKRRILVSRERCRRIFERRKRIVAGDTERR
jgi:hypothetical protein